MEKGGKRFLHIKENYDKDIADGMAVALLLVNDMLAKEYSWYVSF